MLIVDKLRKVGVRSVGGTVRNKKLRAVCRKSSAEFR